MSAFIVGLLTLFLILNCLLLILLVLVQLPKKDAGAGLAFGSGAADALFGAGSGNALTKITKYATIIFLVMSWFLGFLWDKSTATAAAGTFESQVAHQQQHPAASPAQSPVASPTMAPAPTPAASTVPTMPTLSTNRLVLPSTPMMDTNSKK